MIVDAQATVLLAAIVWVLLLADNLLSIFRLGAHRCVFLKSFVPGLDRFHLERTGHGPMTYDAILIDQVKAFRPTRVDFADAVIHVV